MSSFSFSLIYSLFFDFMFLFNNFMFVQYTDNYSITSYYSWSIVLYLSDCNEYLIQNLLLDLHIFFFRYMIWAFVSYIQGYMAENFFLRSCVVLKTDSLSPFLTTFQTSHGAKPTCIKSVTIATLIIILFGFFRRFAHIGLLSN